MIGNVCVHIDETGTGIAVCKEVRGGLIQRLNIAVKLLRGQRASIDYNLVHRNTPYNVDFVLIIIARNVQKINRTKEKSRAVKPGSFILGGCTAVAVRKIAYVFKNFALAVLVQSIKGIKQLLLTLCKSVARVNSVPFAVKSNDTLN